MTKMDKPARHINPIVTSVLTGVLCLGLLQGCGEKVNKDIPVTQLGQKTNGAGVAIVQKHDTLWDIATRFNLPMRDIIALNEVKPPFTIYQGQRLTLPPPREYRVRGGDTLYEISRMFETDMSSVARLNNMRAPYTLQIGQTLRMPSPSGNAPSASKLAAYKPKMVAPGRGYTNKEDYIKGGKALSSGASAGGAQQNASSAPNVPASKPAPSQSAVQAVRSDKVLRVPKRSANARFALPVEGEIISSYGAKDGGLHNDGINIAAPRGATVHAAENGVVAYTGDDIGGYGNLVLIRHEGGYMSAYAHLSQITVKKGQNISRGQTLGRVGATGNIDSPQLHFEIRKGSKALNPEALI